MATTTKPASNTKVDIKQLSHIFSNNFEYLRNEEMSQTEIRKFYQSKIPPSAHSTDVLPQILDIFVQRFEDLQSTEVNSYEAKEIFFNSFELYGEDGDLIVCSPRIAAANADATNASPRISNAAKTKDTSAALELLKRQKPLQNTFLISIDGSTTSDYAFDSTLRLKFPSDKIVLFHTYFNTDSINLPLKYQHEELYKTYSNKLKANMPSESDFHMAFIESDDKQHSAKDVLVEIVKLCTDISHAEEREKKLGPYLPNFVVLGFSGMNNELENRKTLMGSATNIAMRSWQLPVIITKQLCLEEQRTFVMAADCTEPSKRGLDVIASLIRPNDCLILLHITSDNVVVSNAASSGKLRLSRSNSMTNSTLNGGSSSGSSKVMLSSAVSTEHTLEDFYFDDMTRLGLNEEGANTHKLQFITIHREAGSGASLIDMIINCVNEEISPDFLVVVPRSRKHISGVAEELIFRSKASVILCNSL